MKISLNWLRDYVDWEGSIQEMDDLLTYAGLEVEDIEERGGHLDKVVVGQILSSEKHPNADRLSVCTVDDGTSEERQIVCGAKNYKVGDKVPVALPGAILPGDFKIKTGKLRGVESQGMLCSAKELKIGEDAEGLLILPPETEVGIPVEELYKPDVIFDVEVTPNRPDWLSMIGIAREIAALTGAELQIPEIPKPGATSDKDGIRKIEIAEPDGCSIYTARLFHKIAVGPSPAWMKQRLQAVGLRPINNIVDITNYVLMEMGQPLHAFDAAKVAPEKIIVRSAEAGETLEALDEKTYTLREGDLVIADEKQALAIAGVMGGESSGVTESTISIILESARFAPAWIRRTSRDLGIVSDSSYRFERGVDPEGVLQGSARATQLIEELASGQISGPLMQAGEVKSSAITVKLSHKRVRKVLGCKMNRDQIENSLKSLGLKRQNAGSSGRSGNEHSEWRIPSYRLDLTREADLIEEVARVYGIDKIPSRATGMYAPANDSDRAYDAEMQLRVNLAGLGFHEVRTWTVISKDLLTQAGLDPEKCLPLKNPLSEDHTHLRPSLYPGMLPIIEHNIHQGIERIRLFEISRIYPDTTGVSTDVLALVLCGPVAEPNWRRNSPRIADLPDLVGAVERLAGRHLEVIHHPAGDNSANNALVIEPMPDAFALTAYFRLPDSGEILGYGGQLAPGKARALDAKHPVLFASLNLEKLRDARVARGQKFVELPKFPGTSRDISLEAPAELAQSEIIRVLQEQKEPLLRGVKLFDLFSDPSGEKLEAGRKSLAYTLTYRSDEETLDAKRVQKVHDDLVKKLEEELPVELRG